MASSLLKYTCTLLGSVSGILALTLPHGWVFAPIALAFLFTDVVHAESRNDAFIRTLIFGVATGGAGIWWAWGALPFLWLGYTSPYDGAYVILIIWGLVSFTLGVPVAIYGSALWAVRKSPLFPLLAVALWPAAEWGRMWAFTLLAAGENSLIGPHFSIAAIGYSLAENNTFLQVANPGGVYALSIMTALMAMLAVILFSFCKKQTPTTAYTALALMIAIILPISNERGVITERQPMTVAVVHTVRYDAPELPPQFTDVLKAVEPHAPDMLVFPEDHQIFTNLSREHIIASVQALAHNTLVTFPERESGQNGLYASYVTLASSQHGVQSRYQKQFLMPEGEYSPFLSQWIFKIIGDKRVEGYFSSAHRLTHGSTLAPTNFNGTLVGALMCSDAISPYLYRELGAEGATTLINIGDQTWFNGSHLLYDRIMLIAKVHAVESRAYAISANRGSPSFVIDPRGTLIAESAWDTEGVLYATIH